VPAAGPASTEQPLRVPSLVRRYLALGARICGEPAFDRACGTLDFFLVLDFAAAAAAGGRTQLHDAR
jgi:putative hemolysin